MSETRELARVVVDLAEGALVVVAADGTEVARHKLTTAEGTANALTAMVPDLARWLDGLY